MKKISSKEVVEKVKGRLKDRIDHSIAKLDAGKGIPSNEVFNKMEQKYPWLCK